MSDVDRAAQRSKNALSRYGDGVPAWDRQIRLFARYFLCHARLPTGQFSLLDVGCGTGSALSEIHQRYPAARLSGCDLEAEHVEISTALYGDTARFFEGDIAQLKNVEDIIYASNVLEHLPNWFDVAKGLSNCCCRLYVMVPYRETVNGEPIRADMRLEHIHYFTERSFDFLNSGDRTVAWRVIRTPYAWGHSLMRELALRARHRLRGRPFDIQRQLLVAITNGRPAQSHGALAGDPFVSKLGAWTRAIRSRPISGIL